MLFRSLWDADTGILGATPELLFERKGGKVQAMALAGTRPHSIPGATVSEPERMPLLDDPKERAEHQYVIDGVRRSLSPFGKVTLGQTRELRLPSFSHLLTPIELEPSGTFEFGEIARALHPTPALGAFPREAGMRWLESQPWAATRGRFGAPFGAQWKTLVGEEQAQCWVAIRNIQWRKPSRKNLHRVILGAGCGIVEKSELKQEWRELESKARSVRAVFDL